MFDTLAYVEALKAAGVPEEQAKAHARSIKALVEDNLATRRDIEDARRDIKELELRLKHDLTIRLGGIVVAGIAFLAALKFFP